MVFSGISDVIIASVHSEKTRLKKLMNDDDENDDDDDDYE